jgi:O-antigen/teichoic acid export membrane protein
MLRKLVGYAAYMFGASSIASLLTLGVTMLGMSTRPKEAFGDYALYLLIYTTGQCLFVLGVNASIQKFTAGSNENRIRFAKMAYLGFLVLLAVFFTAGVVIWSFTDRIVLAMGCLGVPWVVVFFWGRYIVRSTLEAKLEARIMVVGSLANSILQFVFLTFTDWRDALIYGDVLALVVSGIVAMMLIPAGVQASLRDILKVEIPTEFWKEAFRFAVPLWWAGQVFQLRGILDRSVTRLMLGPKPLGAYQAVITMWQFVAKPMDFFGQAVLPGLASSKEEERDQLYREILRVALLSFCFVSIAVAGGITFVFQSIDFIFGLLGRESAPLQVKYAEVPALILIAVLPIPATAVEMVANQYATILARQHLVFRAQVVTVIALGITIYPLVELFGISGVILAGNVGAVANALTFVIGLWSVCKDSMRTTVRWMIAASFITLLSLIPIYWMRGERFDWLSTFPALAIFVAGAMMLGLLERRDFRRLKNAILRRPTEGPAGG